MRIAIAPNAFRGSLTALQAVDAIADGLRRSTLKDLHMIPMPLADGGDGTLDILINGLGGERTTVTVTGPNGLPVQAMMGLLGDGQTAMIEMARASGVELVPRPLRNPLIATTYGTGELMRTALQHGYRRFVIGIGGSATVDGAAGCMQALGIRLLDRSGVEIPRGGGGLAQLAHIDTTSVQAVRNQAIDITVLCDVTNPLIGANGAARVFGPQKGADPAMVETLEANLTHFADVINRDLGIDVTTIPGGGAAGGFGAGFVAFLGAKLAPGGPTLIALLGYDRQLKDVDLVITGEGKLDSQTGGGKAVQSVADAAARAGAPVIAFAGTLDADSAALNAIGIRAAWSIVPGPCSLDDALTNGASWLARAATEVGNVLALRL
ncbi:MAG: glycerate kinase [Anaerolineae bacterium]|nr:glycerate kinase [Anaerolineae bacterium]